MELHWRCTGRASPRGNGGHAAITRACCSPKTMGAPSCRSTGTAVVAKICSSRGGLLQPRRAVPAEAGCLLRRSCCRAVSACTQSFSVFCFFFVGVSSPEEVDSDSEVEDESASAFFFGFLFFLDFLPFFLSSFLSSFFSSFFPSFLASFGSSFAYVSSFVRRNFTERARRASFMNIMVLLPSMASTARSTRNGLRIAPW